LLPAKWANQEFRFAEKLGYLHTCHLLLSLVHLLPHYSQQIAVRTTLSFVKQSFDGRELSQSSLFRFLGLHKFFTHFFVH
jgi:hypothetical protein